MSPIKTILMHMDDSPACTVRLEVANALAERFDATATALYAALPFLQSAERVILALWADPGDGEDAATGPDIELALRRHGVNVIVQREVASAREVGELLLSKAADLGADLLVMGCYGHGRAREWVLGGASRTVLQSMTVPVLMAH